ncbi:MAG: hypothetical protein ACP5IE_03315 [Infirmifilum sp.]
MECLRYNPFRPDVGDRKKIPESFVYGRYNDIATEISETIKEAASKPIQFIYFLIGNFGTGKTVIVKSALNKLLGGGDYRIMRDDKDVAILEGPCTAIYFRLPENLEEELGEDASLVDLINLATQRAYSKNFEEILRERRCLALALDQLEFATESIVRGLARQLRELFDSNRDYGVVLITTWTHGRGLDIRIDEVIADVKKYAGSTKDFTLENLSKKDALEVVRSALKNARGKCEVEDPYYPFTEKVLMEIIDKIGGRTVNPRTLFTVLGNAIETIKRYGLDLTNNADEVYLLSLILDLPYHKWIKEVENITSPPSLDRVREGFYKLLEILYNSTDLSFIIIESDIMKEPIKDMLLDETIKTSEEELKSLLRTMSEAIDYIVYLEKPSPRIDFVKITTRPTRALAHKFKEFIEKSGGIRLGSIYIKFGRPEGIRITYRIISTRDMPKTLEKALSILTLYRIKWRFIKLEPVAPEDMGALNYILSDDVESQDYTKTVKYMSKKLLDIQSENSE